MHFAVRHVICCRAANNSNTKLSNICIVCIDCHKKIHSFVEIAHDNFVRLQLQMSMLSIQQLSQEHSFRYLTVSLNVSQLIWYIRLQVIPFSCEHCMWDGNNKIRKLIKIDKCNNVIKSIRNREHEFNHVTSLEMSSITWIFFNHFNPFVINFNEFEFNNRCERFNYVLFCFFCLLLVWCQSPFVCAFRSVKSLKKRCPVDFWKYRWNIRRFEYMKAMKIHIVRLFNHQE